MRLPRWLTRAVAATGLAALGVGIAATGPVAPVVSRHKDHDEQPHTPEVEGTLAHAGPDTEIRDSHVLVADDLEFGQLNGRNYLGYCRDCPVAGMGQCGGISGRCPGN